MTRKTEVRTVDSGQAILPSLVDQRLREEGLGLREIRGLIPRECLRRQTFRSWWTLIRILMCVTVCLYLIALVQPSPGIPFLWQLPLLVALWIFYGWVLVGLFALGHECGHYSFSKIRWINTLVGHLCMAPLANGFHSWKLTHNHHHAYTQLRGQEVDWAVHLVTREELNSLSWKKGFMTRLLQLIAAGLAEQRVLSRSLEGGPGIKKSPHHMQPKSGV
jgi:fatty acid desaturase